MSEDSSPFIGNIGFVIIAAFGGYFAINGMISVGMISAFIVYAKPFSKPINEMAKIYGQLQTAIAGAERVFMVLDEVSEDMSGNERMKDEDAAVCFQNVHLSYEPGHPVIQNFTLTVPSGKKVALVGSTGSGKTTVAHLFMWFYDIDSGEIRISDQNIAEVSGDSLRQNAVIVRNSFPTKPNFMTQPCRRQGPHRRNPFFVSPDVPPAVAAVSPGITGTASRGEGDPTHSCIKIRVDKAAEYRYDAREPK